MSDLPTGTLTLLFTDIEGSTGVLARLGPRYADVVSTYRRVLRAAFARWSGHELGTEGDSFFVVFRSAGDAVRAVRDAQTALARTSWPDDEPVRVRMGLHTGEPTPHDDGYVGMDVHRAARVAGAAHGGQVLLTEATYRIASGEVPDVGFADLGLHRLKDLPQPERLHQLVLPGLPADFPGPRSLGSASRLPVPGTSLVGRDDDVARLTGTLARSRLVTLTGPGGAGKTRLALAAAAAVEDAHPDGVFLVPLSPVRATEVMWTTVADVVGAPGESKAPPTVAAHLAPRRVLLVLDNLEQIAEAASVVAALLDAGPGVTVLATSRRPLHLSVEQEVPVEPLPVPDAAGLPGTDGSGAVELFVHRARLVRPSFALTTDNADDVVEICRRLDGLPLAIELVAARSRLLTPRLLLARLDDGLDVARAPVDVPARQQTLHAALTWSYDLLTPALRRAFRALGACGGDVDLAAAAAVLGPDDGRAGERSSPDGQDAQDGPPDAAAALDPVDVVAELVDASLLVVVDAEDEPRVRMLRTVASFARAALRASGERDAVGLRHATHFAEVARAAAEQLRGPHHLAARDRLERELPNLRAALAWSLGDGTPRERPDVDADERLAVGLRLCEHLSWFWYACGYQAEGRRWLGVAVEAAGARTSRAEVVTALYGLAVLVLQQGQADRAREMLERCLDVWRAAGDLGGSSRALNSLAVAHRALGEPEAARRLGDEAVAVAQEAGDLGREVNAVSNLALLAVDVGDTDRAIALLRRCLELDVALEDAWGQGADHVNLAGALLRAGRVDEAEEHLRANAEAAVALNDVEIVIDVVSLFAAISAHRGLAGTTARLLGASARLREQADVPMTATDAAWFDVAIALVEGRPDPASWAAEVAAGRELDAAAAVALALR